MGAQPTLMKRASSFSATAGSRFSKAAGKKSGGDDVIKPPPVKRKAAGSAAASAAGKKTASLARSFESQQNASISSVATPSDSAKPDSIVTSTPATGKAAPEDESPFAFWKRCNLEAILADLDDETDADDENAVSQRCVKKFRELPTAERKEWIAKFHTQKQRSQKTADEKKGVAAEEEKENGAEVAAVENKKKRKLDEEDENKEQKPPTVKSKLAAFAFAESGE